MPDRHNDSSPTDRPDPGPGELGEPPEGPHASAERGDAGRQPDDAPTAGDSSDDTAPRSAEMAADRPTGFPSTDVDTEDDADSGDMSEHARWGDTAYGSAVE